MKSYNELGNVFLLM